MREIAVVFCCLLSKKLMNRYIRLECVLSKNASLLSATTTTTTIMMMMSVAVAVAATVAAIMICLLCLCMLSVLFVKCAGRAIIKITLCAIFSLGLFWCPLKFV